MAIEIKATSRRALVKGAAWAAPVVAASAAVPAYAASRKTKNTCTGTPVVEEFGIIFYDWGSNSTWTGKTTQYLRLHGATAATNLPSDAVITKITSEQWIQERRDVKLGNGSSGSKGPGIYRPTHANSSVSNLGPSYQGTSAVSNQITKYPEGEVRNVSPVFSSSNAKVELMTNDAFTWLLHDNKTTYTSKAWGIKWTGDAAIANSMLTTGANGCKILPDLYTTEFQADYSDMPVGGGYNKTLYVDHIETIYYTSEGQEKVATRRFFINKDACNSWKESYAFGDVGMVDRCSSPVGLS